MSLSAVIGALRVNLGLDTAAFQDGLSSATKSLQKTGRQMQRTGKAMTKAITVPVAGFGALIAKTAGDFEASMNQVGAVSGATGNQLDELRKTARDLGATTQFSASEAADAMKFLSMAGFDANQTIEALPGTLQLAAAASLDLGDAADIVSNILSGYGIQVEELSRVNDVLVKTFTSANTDLRQLGEAMKYAGPVASAAGVQFEEAAAAIGLMGNAGIQGSMAGTSLRGAISRILNPTNKAAGIMEELGLNMTDAEGRIRPLAEILDQLAPHADNAGLFMELFGQRAGPAMAALVSQGAGSLRELTAELLNSGGTAESIAAAQMQGFNGAMKELSSAFQELQIAIAESGFLELLTQMAKGLAEFTRGLGETNPRILKFSVVIAGLAAVIGPSLVVLGLFATGVAAIGLPVAAAIAAVAGLTAAVVAFWPAIKGLSEMLVGVGEEMWAIIFGLPEKFVEMKDSVLTAIADMVTGIHTKFVEMKDSALTAIADMVTGIRTYLGAKLREAIQPAKDAADSVIAFFRNAYDKVIGNSSVPDMVLGIEDWMTRLALSVPGLAEKSASPIASKFESLATSVINQTMSIKDAVRSMLVDLAKMGATSLFGGGAGGGILASAASSLAGALFGFSSGGSFTVPGSGSMDNQLVAFRARPGETVDVRTPGDSGGSRGGFTQTINVPLAFPPELEAYVRNVAGPAGRDAAMQIMRAQGGRI